MSSYPKYINKVMLTKQMLGGHEYTVLYDRKGNKYLKLEKFEIKLPEPKLPEIESQETAINFVYRSLYQPRFTQPKPEKQL